MFGQHVIVSSFLRTTFLLSSNLPAFMIVAVSVFPCHTHEFIIKLNPVYVWNDGSNNNG